MRARPRKKKLLTRRHFLAAAGAAGAAMVACGVESVLIEPTWTHVSRLSIELPRLPRQWDGVKIAHLTDLHVGRFVSLDYARQVVALTNRQGPDIIVVTGDLVSRSEAIKPGLREALAGLSAPEGVYACVGNHDWWHGLAATLSLLRRAHRPSQRARSASATRRRDLLGRRRRLPSRESGPG